MSFYRRRLPHIQEAGRSLFVTWRLYGSQPPNRHSGRDPHWLLDPRVASLVEAAIVNCEGMRLYLLHAYVVMSNHVHILIRPLSPLARITRQIKGATAREANKLLGRSGPFWQDESFDHLVRGNSEFQEIARYIENNPVKAGLALKPDDWPWSSAGSRKAGRLKPAPQFQQQLQSRTITPNK
jgi:REP element-mobilizing transposase RayT